MIKIKSLWILSKEPTGKSYEELIDLAAQICEEFILVRRSKEPKSENVDNLLKELGKFFVEVNQQSSWPGTETTYCAEVYYFKLNYVTKEILKKYSKGLYSWIEPTLLQDLCFLKKDRKPWIINIAHEKFSYLEGSFNEDIIQDVEALNNIVGIEIEELIID
ncbi:hypothetical protein [Clostridium omnivorum]|uniref:hypothetical protein n=1 Tax=Clostridium omnivorum TaxID=1604902 RepID=UPI002230712D|nr:hypothetical protein [Clostridium sp. E14]